MNASESARMAGYKAKSNSCFGTIGHENMTKLAKYVRSRLDELGISDNVLDSLLVDGLYATEQKVFHGTDKVGAAYTLYSKKMKAWQPRRAYLDMANKLKGRYSPAKVEFTDKSKKMAMIPDDLLDAVLEAHTKAKEIMEKPVK